MRKKRYTILYVEFNENIRISGEDGPRPRLNMSTIRLDPDNLPDMYDPSFLARICFPSGKVPCVSTHAFWELHDARRRSRELISHTEHPAWSTYQELARSLGAIDMLGGPIAQAKRDEVAAAQREALMSVVSSAKVREDLQFEDRSPDVDAVLRVAELQLRGYREVDVGVRQQLGLPAPKGQS